MLISFKFQNNYYLYLIFAKKRQNIYHLQVYLPSNRYNLKNIMKYYYSDEKNKIFLNQRNIFFKDTKNVLSKKKMEYCEDLYLYTCTKKTIFFLIKNIKKIKNIITVLILHSGMVAGNRRYNNIFFFYYNDFVLNLKISIKIFLAGLLKKKIILKKVTSKYIFVSSKKQKIYDLPSTFKKRLILQCEPYIKKNKNEHLLLKKIPKKSIVYFIDSHFPLHPDSFQTTKKNYIISELLIDIYIKFIKRKINLKNKKIIIFLHPRTYEVIKKNKKLINNLKNIENKFFFMKGLTSFFNIVDQKKIKKNKIFLQPGTQLSILKLKYKIQKRNIEFISFDDEFLLNFKRIKKKFNSNYLKNYEKFEIDQFKNLDMNKFFQIS